MQKYISFIQKWRWFIVFAVPLLVLLLSSNLKHLQIDGSYRIWFEKDTPALVSYDAFRNEFSNDDGVIIVFRDPNGIFNPKALGSIQRITDAMWEMNHIDRVDSLTNYQHVHEDPSYPDEVLVNDFIEDLDDLNESYLNERRETALADKMLRNKFISEDGTTTMIFARLEPDAKEHGDISAEVMQEVNEIIEPEAKRTGYKYWINGGPAITQAFISIAGKDAVLFTPLVLLSAMLLLYLLFRRISGAVIPILVVLFTFISVIAVQVLMGYKLNNFTANIPVFIVAIGIADAVHIYSVWLTHRREGDDNETAVAVSLRKNFLPILLTSLTTIVGFSTLALSHVVPVATLGIATASGAALAFMISVVWIPALLFLLNKPVGKARNKDQKIYRFFKGYGAFIVHNNKRIIAVTTLFFLFVGAGLLQVKVDSNAMRFFNKDVEIRKSAEFNMAHLTGPLTYIIIADSSRAEGVKDPTFLKSVEAFSQDFKNAFPNDVRHVSSLLDVIKRYNKIYNHQETIPQSHDLVAQYLLLYSNSLSQGMEITDRIDFEQRKLRISVQTNIVDTSRDLEMIEFIKQWWMKSPYSAVVTGRTAMYAQMQKDITQTLITSLSLTILLVSLMMLLIFRRLKILWILMLPNILPVVLVLGVIGWLGITIDMGVAISGAIIIGVAVDDTIHFFVKYFEARRKGLNMIESFNEVLHYAGKAIVFTTIVLSLSFSLFIFSHFAPNQNFGLVTASALIIAMIIDLFFLPALLSLADRKDYEFE